MAKRKKRTGLEGFEYDRINWFPGHMNKAIKEIKKNIKLVDIVIEIRDARVPMASGNKKSYDSHKGKPYLIVFNKTNLADPEAVKLWQAWLSEQEESFVFVNALDKNSLKKIVDLSKKIINAHRLQSNPDCNPKEKVRMMIIGLPNTGKSTIINKLSNRQATKAAATPGQTKVQIWVKVEDGVEIIDTPGVMPARLESKVHGMWLSAIHAIPDHIVTPDDSACFIIQYLLKNNSEAFKEQYKFESLDVDLIEACNHIGRVRGCLIAGGNYDYDHIYKIVLSDFRKGALGLVSFELPPEK